MNENINSAQYRLSGVEPLAGLLNDFVPMQDLSSAHLHSVARSSKLTNLPVGQLIADRNFLDNFYCYLVSGEVAVTHGSSMKPVTYSAEDFGRLSLGDFLKIFAISEQHRMFKCW